MASDINVTVQNSPIAITSTSSNNQNTVAISSVSVTPQSAPVQVTSSSTNNSITVATLGVQGIAGAVGASGASVGVTSINSITGAVSITGIGGVTITNNGQIITVSGLEQTGFYPISNPSGYITGFNSGQYITTGQTGQFYPFSNPLHFANSGNVESTGSQIVNLLSSYSTNQNVQNTGTNIISYINSNSATITNLALTGSNLQNQINGINTNTGNFISNSQTGQFYPLSNPLHFTTSGNLETTGTNLVSYTNATFSTKTNVENTGTNLQGQLNTLSTNLTTTGATLRNLIYGLTGQLDATGAAINTIRTNLDTTGTTLRNLIYGLTGQLDATGAAINTVRTNLDTTGTTLKNLIIGLSGQLDVTGTNLNTRIVTESNKPSITGISVSGSISITGLVSIVGAYGTNVILSGNYIAISGGGSTSSNSSTTIISNVIIDTYQIPSGGSNSKFIQFYQAFNSIPVIIGSIKNVGSGDPILGFHLSGISTSGFYLNFSNTVSTSGYLFNYFAATGNGLFNLGITQNITNQTISGAGVTGISITGSNSITGLISIQGTGNVFTILNGQNIIISGDTGAYISFDNKINLTNSKYQTNNETGTILICQPVFSNNNDGVKLANGSLSNSKNVLGLVRNTGIISGAQGLIQLNGILEATTGQWFAAWGITGGLTFNQKYYLSPVISGQGTGVAPTGAGQYIVELGIATSTTGLNIRIGQSILL